MSKKKSRERLEPTRISFDYSLDFKAIDFRKQPDLYRIGKGEQGVLLVEPYKREILPHWRFKTVAEAKKSSARIYRMFLAYLKAEDFPGADMARKFLQMGWTRARRYANHKGGRKYDKATGKELPGPRTLRRRQRRRSSTSDTSPPGTIPDTSAKEAAQGEV
ncbi:MAG: DUF4385 domain-containing protein [Planctomycetaceae bacterium]